MTNVPGVFFSMACTKSRGSEQAVQIFKFIVKECEDPVETV